uniref:LRRCT domain-containing protein n=1 Tax=Phasianus colchicus TaxID=9054 RepID=A0A669PLI9_PHACC
MLVIRLSVVIKLFFQLEASVCPEKCDCSFKNAIHCSGPHITDLESLNLPCNMTKIHITDTNVTYVQDVFSGMGELQHLILSSNNIALISPEAFKEVFNDTVQLQQLIIENNRLKSIQENLFDRLKVYLDDNPWKCDCQILGFREWLQKSTEVVKEAQSLMCDSPLSLRNISLLALTDHHLKCLPTTAITYQMFKSTYSQTSTSLTMEHLKSSWETVTAVSDLDTSTPTSVPVERQGPQTPCLYSITKMCFYLP